MQTKPLGFRHHVPGTSGLDPIQNFTSKYYINNKQSSDTQNKLNLHIFLINAFFIISLNSYNVTRYINTTDIPSWLAPVRCVNSFVATRLLAEQQIASSCIKILLLSLNAIHNDTNVSVT